MTTGWTRALVSIGVVLVGTSAILGYHAFNIRDLAVAGYPAMPGLDTLHGPPWMRAAYFALGPVFFVLCELMPALLPRLVPEER